MQQEKNTQIKFFITALIGTSIAFHWPVDENVMLHQDSEAVCISLSEN